MTSAMEFANDLLASLRGRVLAPPGGGATPGFDWFGLHSRLSAAHAARREIGRGESLRPAVAGGFAQWRGPVPTTGNSLPVVNPTDSADGKAPAGMENVVTGEPGAGGRGTE